MPVREFKVHLVARLRELTRTTPAFEVECVECVRVCYAQCPARDVFRQSGHTTHCALEKRKSDSEVIKLR